MTYDTWKTTDPADEFLGEEPDSQKQRPLPLAVRERISRLAEVLKNGKPVPGNEMANAFTNLIDALLMIGPAYQICPAFADYQDLKDRAEHIEAIGKAIGAYISALVADTASYSHISRRIGGLVNDAFSDTAGEIMFQAEQGEF